MRHRRLSALIAVPVLTLAACGGGGDSDKDTITDIIKEGGTNPASVCDVLDDALLKKFGGKEGCLTAAKDEEPDDSTKINSLKIDGDKATAKITEKDGPTTINFVKIDGDWKVTEGAGGTKGRSGSSAG